MKKGNKMKTFDDVVTECKNTIKKELEYVDIIGDKICEVLKDIIPDLRWVADEWVEGVDTIDFSSEKYDYFYEYLKHKSDYVSLGEIIEESFPQFGKDLVESFPQFGKEIMAYSSVYVPKELAPQIKERLLILKNSLVEMGDEKC
jgi:hypothetical protein